MVNYIDYNVIDFIEYRERKKGIDLNLYLEIDNCCFLDIYNKTAKEFNILFNELVNLDKELSILQAKSNLTDIEKELYDRYTTLGKHYYERYNFLENKTNILNEVLDKKNISLYKENHDNEYLEAKDELLDILKEYIKNEKDF